MLIGLNLMERNVPAVSQKVPLNPPGHVQLNPNSDSEHSPPLKQGRESQAETESNGRQK